MDVLMIDGVITKEIDGSEIQIPAFQLILST